MKKKPLDRLARQKHLDLGALLLLISGRRTRKLLLAATAVVTGIFASCETMQRPSYIYDIRPAKASSGALGISLTYDGSVKKQRSLFSPVERLLMFRVDLNNTTERVMKTQGCKIIFDYQGTAYEALSKTQIIQWLNDSGFPDPATIQEVAGRKLFNEQMEIYPGYGVAAYVCFPVSPDLAVDGKIKMFDVPSGVREDGSVTKKANLAFSVTRTGT